MIRTLLACVALGSASIAFAQNEPTNQSTHHGSSAGHAAHSDQFLTKAIQDGMAEVQLGELALEKSKDENVRKFAQQMVTDHGQANAKLTQIAQQEGKPVPQKLDSRHQQLIDKLAAKSGSEFDAAYVKVMTKAHANAVSLFKKEASASDSQLASFAQQTLPTLEEHQKMAQDLHSELRTASAGKDSEHTRQ